MLESNEEMSSLGYQFVKSVPDAQQVQIISLDNCNTVEEIDINDVIRVQCDDGKEQCYLPVLDNGEIVMTKLVDVNQAKVNDKDPIEAPKPNAYSHLEVNHKSKYLQLYDRVVRIVPIVEDQPTKSRMVAPNTYRNRIFQTTRKTKIVDAKTMISAKEFKQNLDDTSDLVKTMDLAPRTKKQMRDLVDNYLKLFADPSHKMSGKCKELYRRHCTSSKQPTCDVFDDMQLLPVGYQIEFDRPYRRISRHRNKYQRLQEPPQSNVQILPETINIVDDEPEVGEYLNSENNVYEIELDNQAEGTKLVIIDENGVEHEVHDASEDGIAALYEAAQSTVEEDPDQEDQENEEDILMISEDCMDLDNHYIVVDSNQLLQQSPDTGQENLRMEFIRITN